MKTVINKSIFWGVRIIKHDCTHIYVCVVLCLYLQDLHFFIKILNHAFSNCINPLDFLAMEDTKANK